MLSSPTTLVTTLVLASNGDAATGANPIAGLLPFLLIGVVFYFLIIRPQKRRQAEQQAMVRSIDVGDDIVTIGGFHGQVVDLDEDTMRIELAPGVVVTMARNALSRRVSDTSDLDALDDDPLDEDLLADDTLDDGPLGGDRLADDPLADDPLGDAGDPRDDRA
jgi:preprotein translocase subunit YajC